jgi:hypothetical protein
MTTSQSADVEMLRKVREYLTQYATVIAESEFLQEDVTDFFAKLLTLEEKIKYANADVDITGEDKIKMREAITAEIIRIFAFLSRHALKTDNKMLKKLTDTTPSSIRQMTDTDFIEFCKSVEEKVGDNKADLLKYNVSEDAQSVFIAKIEMFRSIKPQVKLNQSKRALSNEEAGTCIAEVKTFLSDFLDKSVHIVADKNPEFVRLYDNSRSRREPVKASTQLLLSLVDAVTNRPLSNVTVFVSDLKLTGTTDKNGQFTIKVGNKTELICFLSKTGFNNEVLTFTDFIRLKTKEVTVKMHISEMGLSVNA